jgi:hypothetical protein
MVVVGYPNLNFAIKIHVRYRNTTTNHNAPMGEADFVVNEEVAIRHAGNHWINHDAVCHVSLVKVVVIYSSGGFRPQAIFFHHNTMIIIIP